MSFTVSGNFKTSVTSATMEQLFEVLKKHNYSIVKYKKEMTAFKCGNEPSTISIIDCDEYRGCVDIETSHTSSCLSKNNILAQIIFEAENITIEKEKGE